MVFTAGAFNNATVFGGKNADTIVFNPASTNLVTIQSGDGHDVIQATAGGSSNLVVAAGKGADSIALGSNAGTVNGGGLADTITLVAAYAGGIVSGDGQGTTTAGTGTGGAADGADKISFTAGKITGATSVYGGGGADTVSFNANATTSNLTVYAGDGADLIGSSAVNLSAGSFFIDGGAGADTIKMLTLTGSSTIAGGAGADSIFISGSANAASVDGGAGADTIKFGGTPAGVMGSLSAATMITINGGAGSDSIFIGSLTKGAGSKVTVALSHTLVNVVVGSGDSIQFLSGTISSIANWLASTEINVFSSLTKFDSHKAGVNTGVSGWDLSRSMTMATTC